MGSSPKPGGDLPAKPGYTIPDDMNAKLAAKVRAGKACGAHKKKGGYCANPPHKKERPHYPMRCRFHGGASTGPPLGTQNALKHGIYSKFLTDEDMDDLRQLEAGTLVFEIQSRKLRLLKAMAAEAEQAKWIYSKDAATAKDKLAIEEISMRTGKDGKKSTSSVDVTRRRTDYDRTIHNLITQIVKLEYQHHILTGGDSTTAQDKVDKIRAMMANVNQQTGKARPVVNDEDLPE